MQSSASNVVHRVDPRPAGAYSRAIVALVVLGATVLACRADFTALARAWITNPSESYGILIALAIPVLVWLRHDRLGAGTGASVRGTLLLVLACAGYAAARAAQVDLLTWSLLPLVALAALQFALGRTAARTLAVPLGLFWLAVPLWSNLTPLLKWLTIQAATFLLSIVGVPAYVEGPIVTVPAGVFEIADGCSGKNFFIAALSAACLIAVLNEFDWHRAWRLLAVAIVAAILMNWTRVTLLIAIGQFTAMQSPLVADHVWFGWWLFATALVPILLYSRRLGRDLPPRATAAPAASRGHHATAIATAGAVAALAATGTWADAVEHAPGEARELRLPAVSGWSGPSTGAGEWHPVFPGASASVAGSYLAGGGAVDAYVAYFAAQSRTRRMVGLPASVAGPGWEYATGDAAVDSAPVPWSIAERTLRSASGARRVVWYWYEVRGHRTGSAWSARALLAGAAFGAAPDGTVAAVSSECAPDCDAARARLAALLRASAALLDSSAGS